MRNETIGNLAIPRASMKSSVVCLLAVLGLLVEPAWADEAEVDHDDNVQHVFSLTFSPVHLLLPIGELTGEIRITDDIGVAAIVGLGAVKMDGRRFWVGAGGAQFRYYAIGSFIHGMQVGAEIYYTYIESPDVDTVSGWGDGLALGPFIGYKIATNVGFTFDAQLGAQYLTLRAKASNTSGQTASADDSEFIVLLNLNIGWSF